MLVCKKIISGKQNYMTQYDVQNHNDIITRLFVCGKLYANIVYRNLHNSFWKDVVKCYVDFMHIFPNQYRILDRFCSMPLFYNYNFYYIINQFSLKIGMKKE